MIGTCWNVDSLRFQEELVEKHECVMQYVHAEETCEEFSERCLVSNECRWWD